MIKKIKALSKSEIAKQLKKVVAWSTNSKGTQIVKSATFDNHIDALVFIARITVHAQVLNHHPDINFSYKKVKVTLTTHEVKGLSAIDFEMAKRIDSLS